MRRRHRAKLTRSQESASRQIRGAIRSASLPNYAPVGFRSLRASLLIAPCTSAKTSAGSQVSGKGKEKKERKKKKSIILVRDLAFRRTRATRVGMKLMLKATKGQSWEHGGTKPARIAGSELRRGIEWENGVISI